MSHMLILAVLADRPLYGHALIQVLEESGGCVFKVSRQAVYPTLHRLEHLGLVTSSWSMVNEHARRTYQLTPAGRDKLSSDREVWQEFVAVIGALIGTSSHR